MCTHKNQSAYWYATPAYTSNYTVVCGNERQWVSKLPLDMQRLGTGIPASVRNKTPPQTDMSNLTSQNQPTLKYTAMADEDDAVLTLGFSHRGVSH